MAEVKVISITGPQKNVSKTTGNTYNTYSVVFEAKKADGTWGRIEDTFLGNSGDVKTTFKEIDDAVKGGNSSFPLLGTGTPFKHEYKGTVTFKIKDLKLNNINRPQVKTWNGNSNNKTYQKDTGNPQMQTSIEKQVALKSAVEAFPWNGEADLEEYTNTVIALAQAFYDRFLKATENNSTNKQTSSVSNDNQKSDFDDSGFDSQEFEDDIPFK